MSDLHIKVFVTKSKEFRVKIKEPNKDYAYEVTVGGEEWEKGKGREHEKIIKRKCQVLVSVLNSKLCLFVDG